MGCPPLKREVIMKRRLFVFLFLLIPLLFAGSFTSGSKVIATAGVRVQLVAEPTYCNGFTVQAYTGNGGDGVGFVCYYTGRRTY